MAHKLPFTLADDIIEHVAAQRANVRQGTNVGEESMTQLLVVLRDKGWRIRRDTFELDLIESGFALRVHRTARGTRRVYVSVKPVDTRLPPLPKALTSTLRALKRGGVAS